jgi:uncharacterized protein YbaA (DUF1428 family)
LTGRSEPPLPRRAGTEKKLAAHKRVLPMMDPATFPFDGKRMIYGNFEKGLASLKGIAEQK